CQASSTSPRSGVGESRSCPSRTRTCGAQSGMFASRHAPYRLDKCGPCLPLLGEHALPFRGDLVEPAASLVGLFDPRPLDPPTLLEAVEQWIQRIDVKRQLPTGPRVDHLAQLVAVAGAPAGQRPGGQPPTAP